MAVYGQGSFYLNWPASGGPIPPPLITVPTQLIHDHLIPSPIGTVTVYGYVFASIISSAAPVHWIGHPIDFATQMFADNGLAYNATLAANVRAALGPGLRIAVRATSSGKLTEILSNYVYGPFGVGCRIGVTGLRELFLMRAKPTTTPAFTIGVNQIRDPTPTAFDLDETTLCNQVTLKTKRYKVWSSHDGNGTTPPADKTTAIDNTNTVSNGDLGVYGTVERVYTMEAAILFANDYILAGPGIPVQTVTDPDTTAFAEALAAGIFEVLGRGGIYAELDCLPFPIVTGSTDMAVLATPVGGATGTYLNATISSLAGADGADLQIHFLVDAILALATATGEAIFLPVGWIGGPGGFEGAPMFQIGFQQISSTEFVMTGQGAGDSAQQTLTAPILFSSLPAAGTFVTLNMYWTNISTSEYPNYGAGLYDDAGSVFATFSATGGADSSPGGIELFGTGTLVLPAGGNAIIGSQIAVGYAAISPGSQGSTSGLVVDCVALFVNPGGSAQLVGAAAYTEPSTSAPYLVGLWDFVNGNLTAIVGPSLTATAKGVTAASVTYQTGGEWIGKSAGLPAGGPAVGDFVTVDLPFMPGAYTGQSPISQRGTPRLMMVTKRTETPAGPNLRLLDFGYSAAVSVVPTFTLAANSYEPRRAASATLTNQSALAAVTGLKVRVELDFVANPSASGVCVGYIDPALTAKFNLPLMDAGTAFAIRMRSEVPGNLYGAWTAWTPLTLTAYAAPTSLACVAQADGDQELVTFTPSEPDIPIAIVVTAGATGSSTAVPSSGVAFYAIRPAGSTRAVLRNLTPATEYTVNVFHQLNGAYNAATAAATATFTTASTQATASAPLQPLPLVGQLEATGAKFVEGSYGVEVASPDFPAQVVLQVAPETAVGSGAPGTYYDAVAEVATIPVPMPATPSVGRTRIQTFAPNDGLKRFVRAVIRRPGVLDSVPTSAVMLDPWLSPNSTAAAGDVLGVTPPTATVEVGATLVLTSSDPDLPVTVLPQITWASADSIIGTITPIVPPTPTLEPQATFLGVSPGVVVVTATDQYGTQGSATITVVPVGVAIAPLVADVAVGATVAFTASTSGTAPITFSSSNPAVATVNATTGIAKGVSEGNATITATDGTNSATASLAVVSVIISTIVSITPTAATIGIGGTQQFTGASNLGGDTLSYSSSNTAVATVDPSTGIATGVAVGTTNIVVTDGSLSATAVLTVVTGGGGGGGPFYSVVVPASGAFTATLAEIASGYSALAFRIRMLVDPLLAGGATYPLSFQISNSGATVTTLSLLVQTSGTGNLTVLTTTGGTTGNGPAFTLAQSALPGTGTYIEFYLVWNSASGGTAGVYLTSDGGGTVYDSSTTAFGAGGIGSTAFGSGYNALSILSLSGLTAGGMEIQTQPIPSPYTPPLPPTVTGRVGWIFDAQNLTEIQSGTALTPSGTMTYVTETGAYPWGLAGGFIVSPSAATMAVGASITPTTSGGTGAVSWASSDDTVASVDPVAGTVYANALGTATITATDSATPTPNTATVAVTVSSATQILTTFAVTPATATVAVGAPAVQITDVPLDQNGDLIVTAVTWASSDTAVATVNSSGLATGVAAGTANIVATATASGKTATAVLTVTSKTTAVQVVGVHVNAGYQTSTSVIDSQIAPCTTVHAKIARDIALWHHIEATEGTFVWTYLDRVVADYLAAGITPYITIYGMPSWTAGYGGTEQSFPTDQTDFTNMVAQAQPFITALITRYAGRVKYWEFYNEPNQPVFWVPAPNVNFYVQFNNACYETAKAAAAAAGASIVWVAGCVTGLSAGPLNPGYLGLTFLKDMVSLGCLYDAISIHPYNTNGAGGSLDPTVNNAPADNSFVDTAAVIAALPAGTQIHITEFGWDSASSSTIAGYVTAAFNLVTTTYKASVPIAIIYALSDNQEAGWGILTTAYAFKLQGTAFLDVAEALGQ